ncbi:hypothetical protein FRC07_014919 [Ceratobasidium sp. 392]|nr:hypothetical protein FRC07_014919 [Ceratobasidium sp. 392]
MSSARPRPRPRPKPKGLPDASVSGSPSATSGGTNTPVKSPSATDNDDDLFLRHDPNRFTATYSQQKKTRSHSPTQDVTYFNQENSEDSPESKRRRKEMGGRSKPLPAWTYRPREVSSVPLESDDDSSGPEILDDDISPAPSQPLPKPKLRERSITPPPDDIKYQASSQARAVLSKLYYDDDREPSPEGESQDAIELLPELAAIQRNVRATSATPESAQTRTVELHIRWFPHPEQPQYFENGDRSWAFEVPQNKAFGEVRRMLTGLPPSLVVLRCKGRRLFDGGTPASLFAGKKLEIQAMTLATHQYYEERHQDPLSVPPSDDVEDVATNSREGSPAATENKITLRLRTGPKDNHPQTVRVLSNSTIETVIAAFLSKTGRTGMQGVRLQIDGEDLDMDSTIADADLEDGDLVEVAGIEK